jgi:hypothetical protein
MGYVKTGLRQRGNDGSSWANINLQDAMETLINVVSIFGSRDV